MAPRPYHLRPPRPRGQVQISGVVVHLPSPKVHWDLVRALEKLVREARSGRLQYFTGTGMMADRYRVSVWGGECEQVFAMAGAIEWLKMEFMQRIERDNGRG